MQADTETDHRLPLSRSSRVDGRNTDAGIACRFQSGFAGLTTESPPWARGPDDATLLRHTRQAIAESCFTGERYRKIWARLLFCVGSSSRVVCRSGRQQKHRTIINISKTNEKKWRRFVFGVG